MDEVTIDANLNIFVLSEYIIDMYHNMKDDPEKFDIKLGLLYDYIVQMYEDGKFVYGFSDPIAIISVLELILQQHLPNPEITYH